MEEEEVVSNYRIETTHQRSTLTRKYPYCPPSGNFIREGEEDYPVSYALPSFTLVSSAALKYYFMRNTLRIFLTPDVNSFVDKHSTINWYVRSRSNYCGKYGRCYYSHRLIHLSLERRGSSLTLIGQFWLQMSELSSNVYYIVGIMQLPGTFTDSMHMNHIREGGTAGISLSASAALCRISSAKSAVQVRCRACQEILSCPLALREHCESRAHSVRIAQLASMSSDAASVRDDNSAPRSMPASPETVLECRHCSFETTNTAGAIEHMQQHPPNVESTGAKQESLNLEVHCGSYVNNNIKNAPKLSIIYDHVQLMGSAITVVALKFSKLVFALLL
ncbi:unnamed protein product [Onchocerca ochengi]|uniref:C2H2-type domain-containing protein n=1 Tax=Onchocerca ochengi TaxID=42157 RepID=A0A182EE23_ONCOC|nr:unnamed protein product [Onchocerca ochengi]